MSKLTEILLARPGIYRLFRKVTGSERLNREFVNRYVRPHDGEAILDVGCGPGDALQLMPRVQYVGIDLSRDYIALAQARFSNRATFVCGNLKDLNYGQFSQFDAVIAMGVLHHLDDRAVGELLSKIRRLLKPGGRFVSYDPCFTEPQHPFARWVHRHDRGQYVRFDQEYETLIASVFDDYSCDIRTDL